MSRSFVVTGAMAAIGRALVERLLGDEDSVVAIELDPAALTWTESHPAGSRVLAVAGDAADEAVAEQAADLAQSAGALAGWLTTRLFSGMPPSIPPRRACGAGPHCANLHPAVVGCATAIRRFLAAGTQGAIVNVSSYQALQAVPGCLPYVTAKAVPSKG